MLKLAALENNKNQDLEKKEGRIDDLLRVSSKPWRETKLSKLFGNSKTVEKILSIVKNQLQKK